ncbi:MAG: argininosuccinate lyase [Gemmatimonadetes bacterium]|nr:argininosuccinate lyase [Gemmatimonadota bacterium]
MTKETISRERLEAPPGEVFTETIQKPLYAFSCERFYYPLVTTNKAWTVMLVAAGIIAAEDGRKLLEALDDLESRGPEALGDYDPRYEYFYSHMEKRLTDWAGEEVAGNINIGRTRPEPLARIVVRAKLIEILDRTSALRATLVELAEREADTVMPQWTHYQPAQISTVGHYLLAIADAVERDAERLHHAYRTVNRCTLGCGALAGTSYPVDRQLVADLLGFDSFKENTIDCVSGAEHLTEPVAAVAGLLVTLSRFCQDLYTWHTWEFRMVEIGDEFSGSSSMMPQKKNPYPFEYVRALAGQAIGQMTSVHAILHNTNFQDIKEVEDSAVFPVIECLEDTTRAVTLLNGTVGTLRFHRERLWEDAAQGFGSCTELAARLQRQFGFSYRSAHRIVGDTVLRAYRRGLNATQVDAELVNESARAVVGRALEIDDAWVQQALDPRAFVEAHAVPGGPALAEVRRMLEKRRQRLEEERSRLASLVARLEAADRRLRERVAEVRVT